MTEIIAIDPGGATGIGWYHFSDTQPLTYVDGHILSFDEFSTMIWNADGTLDTDILVVERFRLLQGNEFTADLTGVRVEGVIDHVTAVRIEKVAQYREDKALVDDQILKDHGLWRTGKDVDWTDGRDVNDCTIHALVYLAFRKRHKPTLEAYFHGR